MSPFSETREAIRDLLHILPPEAVKSLTLDIVELWCESNGIVSREAMMKVLKKYKPLRVTDFQELTETEGVKDGQG